MARDTSLPLRRAVVTALRDDNNFTALGSPALDARIYGMRTPAPLTWPFTRYGSSDAVPFLGQCLDGARVRFAIHAFSKAKFEDECAEISAGAAAALDGKTIELDADYDATAHLRWLGTQIITDAAEASAWHGIVAFEATVSS
jgi:hypothetical protein